MKKTMYYLYLERNCSTYFYTYFQRSIESFTEDEAFIICNESIYATPAVMAFPDKLAEEDLDIVVEQCVYDLRVRSP